MTDINPSGIAAAALGQTLAGFLVYGPLFSGKWLDAMRQEKNDSSYLSEKPEASQYGLKLATSVAMDCLKAYILARFLRRLDARDPERAVKLTFYMWLGLVAPSIAGELTWEERPPALVLLRGLNSLIGSLVGGFILYKTNAY